MAGDALIFYTDGVIEARSANGMFGEERLIELVSQLKNGKAELFTRAIFETISDFSEGKLSDDVAILALVLN